MIVYELKCDKGHQFEAWFKNRDFFEHQRATNSIGCPFCASQKIEIVLTPPRILKGKSDSSSSVDNPNPSKDIEKTNQVQTEKNLFSNSTKIRQMVQELQKTITKNCDYVGRNFAEEARKIHYGEKQAERGIYGETTQEEAKSLKDEGIEFTTLPWGKTNA